MRIVVAIVIAAAALAACGQGGSGGSTAEGTSPAEEKVATAIVEAGGVLILEEQTLSEVVAGQVQFASMENPDLTPEQLKALSAAVRKHIDAALPDLRKEMTGYLAEAFNEAELKTYQAFVAAPKEGESIKDRVPEVMQKSIAAADAMTSTAVEKALAEVKPAAPAAPAEPAKPTDPQ
jgi:hypothetical protein